MADKNSNIIRPIIAVQADEEEISDIFFSDTINLNFGYTETTPEAKTAIVSTINAISVSADVNDAKFLAIDEVTSASGGFTQIFNAGDIIQISPPDPDDLSVNNNLYQVFETSNNLKITINNSPDEDWLTDEFVVSPLTTSITVASVNVSALQMCGGSVIQYGTGSDGSAFVYKELGTGAVTQTVNQVAHLIPLETVVYYNLKEEKYKAAVASDLAGVPIDPLEPAGFQTNVIGIVIKVIDVDNFVIAIEGVFEFPETNTLTKGDSYFLSTTVGEFTELAPTTTGAVKKPLFNALSPSTAYIFVSIGWTGRGAIPL